MSQRDLDAALRERLAMAGCYPKRPTSGGEVWFTPHLNCEFTLETWIGTASAANAALRRAGLEEAF
jgi:hypothetical protein